MFDPTGCKEMSNSLSATFGLFLELLWIHCATCGALTGRHEPHLETGARRTLEGLGFMSLLAGLMLSRGEQTRTHLTPLIPAAPGKQRSRNTEPKDELPIGDTDFLQ
jgi:hypothetical protein